MFFFEEFRIIVCRKVDSLEKNTFSAVKFSF